MTGFISDIIKEGARSLRKNMTLSEKILWEELKDKKLKYKFLRQKPIYLYTEDYGLDRYIIADFICLELKLIIEVDGSVHDNKDVYFLDLEKEKLLKQKGYKIIRIQNEEIINDLSSVIRNIQNLLN